MKGTYGTPTVKILSFTPILPVKLPTESSRFFSEDNACIAKSYSGFSF
jgi:hypothetical protein